MLGNEAPYQKNKTESEGWIRVIRIEDNGNNAKQAFRGVKARNRRIPNGRYGGGVSRTKG